MLIHELIHALIFMIYAKKGFESIKIGIIWKFLTPYAHCKEPLRKSYYLTALVMPAVVLGVVPIVISIIMGKPLLMYYGLLMSMAAAGDFLIFMMIIKVPKNRFILDHDSKIGFYIIEKHVEKEG